MGIKLITFTLNGKKIAFSSETDFYVQLGKGKKGSYSTKYSFKGDLARAVFYYESINIGNGYKKRLYSPAMNKPVLLRAAS